MSAIQKFVADLLNGFSFNDIPLLLFQLFAAAFCGWVSARILNGKEGGVAPLQIALIAAIVALLVSIVKNSIPLSVALAAVACLSAARFYPAQEEKSGGILFFLALGTGLGCGSGFVIQTGVGFVFVLLPLMWFYRK